MAEQVTLVVQAGGRSSRMGEDKALKPLCGRPLIQWVVERLAPLADEILVTSNRPGVYDFLGLRILPDLIPERGVLGGLYTGISFASHPIVAAVACDMPFANVALFELAARLLIQEEVDAVVPRSSGGLEPMHAVYRRETCLPVIRSAVEANRLKAIDWFPSIRLRELGEAEIASLDPAGLAFWNINTPEEFARAEKLCAV